MTTREKQLLAAIRNNFYAYLQKAFVTVTHGDPLMRNWHLEAIAWHLQQCVTGDCKRLIITLPPRNLKSVSASVALPTWILGLDPTRSIICVSYGDSLARDFSRDRRKVMESKSYRQAFPGTRFDPKKNTETEIYTTKGGKCIATSIGGSLTGKGGNFIILDDPMKADDAFSEAERERVLKFYRNTLVSRLNNKTKDVIIIVTQRLHVDDLVANVLELDDWTILDLPAIAIEPFEEIQIDDNRWHERKVGSVLHPEREPLAELEKLKKSLGSMIFSAQYQQSPVPEGGNMIRSAWFKTYDGEPKCSLFDEIVQSWDTAAETGDGNSYSVCVTCGVKNGNFYILDVLRERMGFPALLKTVESHAGAWGAHRVLVEKASSGIALVQSLNSKPSIPVIPVKPLHDKVTRAAQQSALVEAGRLWLPEEAPWLAEFVKELLSFPHSKFTDQVDALMQLLEWSRNRTPPRLASRVTVIGGEGSITVQDNYFARNGVSVFSDLFD